ncbi:MAG: sigma-54-dependent transcriptional regulator [Janthinobacterium lividum]
MSEAFPLSMLNRGPGLRDVSSLPSSLSAASMGMPAFAPVREQPGIFKATSTKPVALRVLVVEDDAPVRHACVAIATGLGYTVEQAESVPMAKLALKRNTIDILLLDLKLPGGGGFSILEEVREHHPRMAAVVMTAFATVNSAVEAMRTGAGDYIAKPFTVDELTAVLERAADRRNAVDESRILRERLRSGKAAGMLVGQSPPMEKLFRMVSKVAYTSHPVLIAGESGTGKELVARAIHANGPAATRPFIPVDCGSLVPSLLEGELFGYAPGMFPGSSQAKTGLLAAAGGGTVFLDEIGDLPLDLQAKLLRALHEKEVRPAGSLHSVPLDARVLAATNRDLPALVETGRFRKDLFYRLNVVNIRIPPLRERTSDVPLLAAHVLDRISRERGQPYSFSDDALRLLIEYEWPGNVRELENAIERACALSSGPVVHQVDLPSQLQEHRYQHRPASGSVPATSPSAGYRVVPIVQMEKEAILNTLHLLKGDKLRAAKLLGIGKTTLYRKLKEYGLDDDLLM